MPSRPKLSGNKGVDDLYIPPTAFHLLHDDPSLCHEDRSIYLATSYLKPTNISDLVQKVGHGRRKVVAGCRRLVEAGWLRLHAQGRHLKPLCWVPHRQQRILVAELENDFDMAPLGGEFLMGGLMALWIDCPRIISNARPDFLLNPKTGERLELDRYIEGLLAAEFNGIQHYSETAKYNSKQVGDIKAYDLMKEGMCKKAGIPLISVATEDLCVEGMKRLFPPGTPLHYFDVEEPYARGLDKICAGYRRKVARFQPKAQ